MAKPLSGWEALRKLNILEPITHVVQVVERPSLAWRTMAGFDCCEAAESYWEQCTLKGDPGRRYRVQPVEL